MARSREVRFDLRGGVNLSHTQDVLDRRELRRAKNARSGEYGGVRDRDATQRIHGNEIGGGSPILGLKQWIPTAGRQVVGISNGNLYHKLEAASEFSEEAAAFSSSIRPGFATHRVGGDPRLFIADGTLRMWDGSTLSTVTGAPDARRLAVYKTRMFAIADSKFLFASATDDPLEWSTTNGAIVAPVETYSDEPLVALDVVGSSLLLFKPNSIARFTGVSAADIRLDQETEGISADVGTIAPGTVIRMEEVVFFLTDRGPYIASEAGVQFIGRNVEPAFDEAEMDHMSNAVAVHHRGRREVWVFFPENTQTENTVGWCFNYRLQNWYGPWKIEGYNVCSVAEFERPDNTENVILGGYDGRVRLGDNPALGTRDDVLPDGTGGIPFAMELQFPDLMFGDPTALKRMNPTQQIAADLGESGHLTATFKGDRMRPRSRTLRTKGPGVDQYLVRPGVSGRRITMTLTNSTHEVVQVNAVLLEATMGRRYA
jgi:hypothetical protein